MTSLTTEPTAGERGRIGDRLTAFTACLPAKPQGMVLIFTAPDAAEALEQRFATALSIEEGDPLPPEGSVGLLILDGRRGDTAFRRRLIATVGRQGVVARIGRKGSWAVYPSPDSPEQLWTRGWPKPQIHSRRMQLRRNVGLATAELRGVPRLDVQAFGKEASPTLADLVAEDVGARLGQTFALRGVVAAGVTVLRLTSDTDDIAVRLSCTDRGLVPHVGDTIALDVPGLRGLIPPVIARGTTADVPWVATPWLPYARGSRSKAARISSARLLERVALMLEARPLGRTSPGWAEAWVDRVDLLPNDHRDRLVTLLRRLEGGLSVGWCHGDPWAGNVLYDGSRGYVIDWDNAVSDAPIGLDRLLIELLGQDRSSAQPMSGLCHMLIDSEDIGPVGGRRWLSWDRQTRVALLVAAYLVYLRNRALHDLGASGLQAELAGLRRLADLGLGRSTQPASAMTTSSGAGWLGLGAGMVKASQTIVLLVLAAMLAPSAIGVLSIGALVLNVISTLSDLGSSTALVYWRGDAERAARSALSIAIASAAVLTTSAWLIAPWLADALHAGSTGIDVIRGLSLCLPFISVAGVSQELLRRDLAFKRRVVPDIIGALAGGAIAVVLAAQGHGAMSLVIGQLVQYALIMVLCWVMRPPVLPRWNRNDASGLISYGGGLAGANVVQLLMLNVDYIIVARYLGTQPLGAYSMAFRLAYMPYLLIAVVLGGAAFAHLCRLEGSAVGEGLMRTVGNTLILVAPLYVGVILLAPDLEILGGKWAPAVPALRWLAVYGLALSFLNLCMVGLNAVSRTRDTFVLNLIHLGLLVALLLATVRGGVTSVGVAQAIAGGTSLLIGILFVRRRVSGLRVRLIGRRVIATGIGSLAMVGTWVLCETFLPPTRGSLADLLTDGPLLLGTFMACAVVLDPSTRERIARLRGGRR